MVLRINDPKMNLFMDFLSLYILNCCSFLRTIYIFFKLVIACLRAQMHYWIARLGLKNKTCLALSQMIGVEQTLRDRVYGVELSGLGLTLTEGLTKLMQSQGDGVVVCGQSLAVFRKGLRYLRNPHDHRTLNIESIQAVQNRWQCIASTGAVK